MEGMTEVTFLQGLTLLLVGLLFFREEIMPWIKGKLGISNEREHATRGQMDKLSNYYNHDTTELLQAINTNVVKVHQNVEKVHLTMREVERQLEGLQVTNAEWEKFGIPTRNLKDKS